MTVAECGSGRMDRLLLLFTVFTVLCSVLYAKTVDITHKKLIVRRLEQCKGYEHLPLLFHKMVIVRNNVTDEVAFDFELVVREEVSNNFAIVFSLSKCDSSGNPDSCEFVVKDYNATNVCELILAKNEVWSVFIEKFDPPLFCPIKPGVYHMNRCPVSTETLEFMPISDAVWKMDLVGWDTGKMLSCVNYEEQVLASYRQKPNKTKH